MEAARPTSTLADGQRLGAMAANRPLWATANSGCSAWRALSRGREGAVREAGRWGAVRARSRLARCSAFCTRLDSAWVALSFSQSPTSGPRLIARMSLSNKLTLDKLDVKGKRVVMR